MLIEKLQNERKWAVRINEEHIHLYADVSFVLSWSGETWVILKLLDFDLISNFKSQHYHVRNYHIKLSVILKAIKQSF